ncbi:MAG: hypothetical protein ABIQ73_11640 [Acidimicrobiales bacterium]
MNSDTLRSIVESPITALLVWPLTMLALLAYEFSRVAPAFVKGRRAMGIACVPLLFVFFGVVIGRFVLLHD